MPLSPLRRRCLLLLMLLTPAAAAAAATRCRWRRRHDAYVAPPCRCEDAMLIALPRIRRAYYAACYDVRLFFASCRCSMFSHVTSHAD